MSQTDFASRLATLRANNCDQLPTPELAILTRTISRLRDSGIERKCLQQGETAPDFTFINDSNQRSSLYDLVQNGPVVINFFSSANCQVVSTFEVDPPGDSSSSIFDDRNESTGADVADSSNATLATPWEGGA